MIDLADQLTEDLLAYDEAEHAEHKPGIWPSDVRVLTPGRGCRRQLAYRLADTLPSDKVPDWLIRTALAGTATHAVIEKARALSHPTWWLERRVRVPGFDRDGRLDAYMDDTATVDDVKTKGERPFERILDRGDADDPDRNQVLLYGLAVEELGMPVKVCSVTYVSRSTLDSHVVTWTYDRREAEDVAMRMFGVLDAVNVPDPEEVPRDGRAPHWSPCDTCPFRSRCWDLEPGADPAAVVAARATPEEVAIAAETLMGLREEAGQNKDAQDWCRAVLLGHSGEEFTGPDGIRRLIRWSRDIEEGTGGRLDTKTAREILEARGLPVPLLGSSPKVTFPAVRKKGPKNGLDT